MPTHDIEPAKLVKLRRDAERKLKTGAAPATVGWSLGVNALSLIHKLASSPASADDALKLLHEVQVHQVELDLQHEQIETTQRELGTELAHFQELFERAPVGYISVSPQREILECNLAAASLLGTKQDDARGRDIETFLAPASRPVLRRLLTHLNPDGSSDRCEVHLAAGSASRKLQVVASLAPGSRSFLAVLIDLPIGH